MRRHEVRKRFIVAAVVGVLISVALVYEERSRALVSFPDFTAGTLVVPVRVHLLRSRALPAANCELTTSDATGIIARVNQIWEPAQIRVALESIREEEAANASLITLEDSRIPHKSVRDLRPRESLQTNMLHVYFVHLLYANGACLDLDAMFVQDTAVLRPVPGGIDTPLPRVTGHEIGHAFGLPHHRVATNLMAMGTSGTTLTATDVQIARLTVARFPFARRATTGP